MARRSNFSFERMQRDRDKAAKREAKRAARAARKNSPDGAIPAAEPPPTRAPNVTPGPLPTDD